MPRTQKNDNFIDKSFTVMADLILKMLPAKQQAKEAFAYYRDGMSAQADGEYAEALDNYKEALTLEEDPYDKGYILYNMGLIHASNGQVEQDPSHPRIITTVWGVGYRLDPAGLDPAGLDSAGHDPADPDPAPTDAEGAESP